MPWRGPSYEGELPTLGWHVLEWIEDNLIVPDGPSAGEPLVLTAEQARFVLTFYAIDPRWSGPAVQGGKLTMGRSVRRAILSRPKGWGKSPLLAALCLVEALADVVPDGWDANGEPVGRAWSSLGFKPKVQIVAVSEDQTGNTWDPLLEMAREGPVARNYGIEAMESFVNVPRGRVEYTTSAARSREGFRPVFAVMDQTESWVPSIGGDKLAASIRRNLTKTGGTSVETPNAFIPGENSVAERSYEAWKLQEEGRLRNRAGILFDHREAPPETDPADPESLRAGLEVAYGDSVWVDLERVMADYYDPASDPQDSRRYFLNQVVAASDSWLTQPQLAAIADATKVVADRAQITLGFDGSKGARQGPSKTKPDATALIGCDLRTGHLFEVGVWEAERSPSGLYDWTPPEAEIEAAVAAAFRRYRVVGFYADPAHWETRIAQWEATYGRKMVAKASREHPLQWWVTGGRSSLIVNAVRRLHDAIADGSTTYDGSSALTRHLLNARRRVGRSGVSISKEHPDSDRKIDAAFAAVLAWEARHDAILAGALTKKGGGAFVPRRIQ